MFYQQLPTKSLAIFTTSLPLAVSLSSQLFVTHVTQQQCFQKPYRRTPRQIIIYFTIFLVTIYSYKLFPALSLLVVVLRVSWL